MFDIQSYYEAKTVKDAVRALKKDKNAIVICGGTDVLIRIREGKDAGISLVGISRIPELGEVRRRENGDIEIGAAMTFARLTEDPVIRKYLPMLGEAVDQVGGPQTRAAGTIGGNIMNGATSADSAATLMTLNAEIVLEGPKGESVIPIREFYTGPGQTVRERTQVCKYFLIRKKEYSGWTGTYLKYGKRRAMEITTLGCAVRVKLSADKQTFKDVRLAYAVAAPTPVRCLKAESFLKGKAVSDADAREEFAAIALTETSPRSSWRASKEFRQQLIGELAKRALQESVERSGKRDTK